MLVTFRMIAIFRYGRLVSFHFRSIKNKSDPLIRDGWQTQPFFSFVIVTSFYWSMFHYRSLKQARLVELKPFCWNDCGHLCVSYKPRRLKSVFFFPVHSHLGKAVLWLKRFSISPIFFFKSLTNFCTNAFVYRHAHGGNSILFFFHFFSLFAWIVFCVCVCVFADKRWRTFRSSKKKRQWKKTQSLRHDIPPDWNRIDRIGLRPKNFKVSLSHFLRHQQHSKAIPKSI